MMQGSAPIAIAAGAAAFGAANAVLAAMALGVPFLVAALGAAVLAGLVVYAVAARTTPDPASLRLLQDLEVRTAALRHDLRGALSPALMVADRLLNNADPAVRRAGEAVVRSVDRATALLDGSKRDEAAATPDAPPAAAAPPR